MKPPQTIAADAPFSYACRRCNACCTNKRIQVNPYEAARLARNRGIALAELRARYLTDDAVLAQDDAGRCLLLGEQGCSVHADRPLVCRLFPLGRVVLASGESRLVRPEYDPPANGDFGHAGTPADYVASQGAAPFIAAADAYFRWFCAAKAHLAEDGEAADAEGDLLDLDAQVTRWCAEQGVDEPEDIDARRALHIEILYRALETGGSDVRN